MITTNAASVMYIVLHKVSKRLGSIRQIYCKSCHIMEGKRGMSNLRISATNNIVYGMENIYFPRKHLRPIFLKSAQLDLEFVSIRPRIKRNA